MQNVVMYISFNLVKGASVPDFLLAAEKLEREHLSGQKGYISWKQLRDGDTWVDLMTWASAEDAQNSDEASCTNPLAHEYFAFLDPESVKTSFYTVERAYAIGL